ncbi:hypothetical protein Leryth_024514 [Lithospermum erythrorhizon]|nr:hypothetical protein Leryth_024514 [Lithospermum erythrorhizon]
MVATHFKDNMSGQTEDNSSHSNRTNKSEDHRGHFNKDAPGTDLWTNGLICAFEFVRGRKKHAKSRSYSKNVSVNPGEGSRQVGSMDDSFENEVPQADPCFTTDRYEGSHWVPIGWSRISELVQGIEVNAGWSAPHLELLDEEDDVSVADLAAPYWERPGGPVWWCHVVAGHPSIDSWLTNAQWLHPAISIALKDESRLISDRMRHLLYEVPVRVAGGLLFELLGQSVGSAEKINVLGITEVQELLLGGGFNAPRTAHEVIAHLASRLARWDDRLFRKSIFGAADEVELKTHEDCNIFWYNPEQEIRRLSQQVIRVKWSLHAREEIVFELLQHLRGTVTRTLLEGIRKSTRQMIEEQEAVRGRLFTIQDVMQSTVRAWLQDRSLRVTHNLAVFGGCGLVLSIITGLFGINVDGIPGAENTPYAFSLFTGLLFFLGIVLIIVGLIYLGLKNPISEQKVEIRKLELQELVKMFQHEAETHAQVRQPISRNNLPPTAADNVLEGADYVLIH